MSIFPKEFDPTYQDYVTKFLEYEEEGEGTLWQKGDLLLEFTGQVPLDDLSGFKAEQEAKRIVKSLRSLASDVAKHHKTLERWRYTAHIFQPETRIADLSFSHHTVAAYSQKPLYWLQKAADKEWSKTQLLNAIKAAEHPEEAWVTKTIRGTAKVLPSTDSICFAGDDFELAWDVKSDDPLIEWEEPVEVEARIKVRRSGAKDR